VYPVVSRRARGVSIGVNLNPDKVCNFDCVYCSVDRKSPPAVQEVDLAVVERELEHLLRLAYSGELFEDPEFARTPEAFHRVNDVAFSGDGEPTSYRRFGEACALAAGVIERLGKAGETKIVLITNSTLLHRPSVQERLRYLDTHNGEVWAKLDAGTEAYYRQVERTAVPFARVLENILTCGREREIVIQSMFMTLNRVEPHREEIGEYVERLKELKANGCRIRYVQVYTVARGPAESYVGALGVDALEGIAGRVRRETGLRVEVFE
jgi:wyosine [tRNA(Phe)-imidazoG37] synthetase (radical SAM superfamily)